MISGLLNALYILTSLAFVRQISRYPSCGRPGQYTFVCVPAVAIHEWHPFTISSAPGNSVVSVHIRVVGDWTTALWDHLQEHILEVSALNVEYDVRWGLMYGYCNLLEPLT